MTYEKQGFINDELLTDEFYLRSISLFLKNSFGMADRCKMYNAILNNVVNVSQELFEKLDIFYYKSSTDNYLQRLYDTEDFSEYASTDNRSKWLDLIGDIFGVQREFYIDQTTRVDLSDFEFLIYIQAVIAKNTYHGTRQELTKLYTGSSINYYSYYDVSGTTYDEATKEILKKSYQPSFLSMLDIKYFTSGSLIAFIFWSLSDTLKNLPELDESYIANLIILFQNGYLTVESMGIVYERFYANGSAISDAKFDSAHYSPDAEGNVYLFG